MSVYYSDNEPFIGGWLAELVKAGELPDGDLCNASIRDIKGSDLVDYTECHFFAGIGGWPLALRLADWPADRPVWTGSCPCQPFSAAGKRGGTSDVRHLWPEFLRLISECRPPTIFGEQVASKDGRLWLAGVRADLEALGYAVGAADLCAAGVGAPHIRQRLWWVADANGGVSGDGHLQPSGQHGQFAQDSGVDGLEHCVGNGLEGSGERDTWPALPAPWSASIGVPCTDGKLRRIASNEQAEIEPSLFPLAHGIPNRVGALRGAGNAIVPHVAAEFIRAFLDA